MMKKERREEIKQRARYFAAGLVENVEATASGQFDDLSYEEQLVVEREMQRIGKRIYKENN